MKATRMLFIALLVAVTGAFGAATASATETATLSPSLVTGSGNALTLSNNAFDIFCDLDLTATLESTIVLELDELTKVGAVTSGAADNCGEGNSADLLVIPETLPGPTPAPEWDIAVLLPLPTGRGEIANLRILDAAIDVTVDSISCLYAGDLLATLIDTNANGRGDRLTFAAANNELDLIRDPTGLCGLLGGPNGTLAGAVNVAPEVTLTLL